jgi:hypothetical protein
VPSFKYTHSELPGKVTVGYLRRFWAGQKDVGFHSCGKGMRVIPELIDLGVDVSIPFIYLSVFGKASM